MGLVRVRFSIAVSFFFAACLASGTDDAQAPITLTPSSAKSLGVPVGSFSLPIQCDAKGNIYFYAGRTTEPTIFEVRADGSHFMYGLSGQDANDLDYVSYSVDADGKLWLLVGDKADRPQLFEFHDDATTPVRTKLDAPEDMPASTVYNFVTLQNGHVLLQGYGKSNAGNKGGSRAYLAEYDPSGKLIRKSVEKGQGVDITEWPSATAAAQGADGSIYILKPEKVLVLSPTGDLSREIKLLPPTPEYRPFAIHLDGQRLAVEYSKTEKGPHKLTTLYALLDASTGQQLRLYQPSPELGNSLVCFSSAGFTFYRVEHGRINLLNAVAN